MKKRDGAGRMRGELGGMRFMHKSLRGPARKGEGPAAEDRWRSGGAAQRGAAVRYAGSARTINYLLIPSKKPVQVRPSGHTDATTAGQMHTHAPTRPPAWTVFYRHI